MPNISGHMAVAKRVSEILGIDSDDFYRGNLLPDLYEDKIKSHYKVKGELFYIPDIEEAKKNLNLKDLNDLGVLSHLLLDKYYFGEYLKDNSFFRDKSIYKDYDIINKDIVKYFDLDVERIINSFKHFKEDISTSKLDVNIRCIQLNEGGITKYLDKDDFIRFLEESSERIAKELENYL